MNRREFIKIATASASLLALPSRAIASVNELVGGAERRCAKITRIRIGLLPFEELASQKRFDYLLGRDEVLPDNENNYWAEAIEYGDKLYYRVNGTTVEITEYQFGKVIDNPRLYYFSTALKLHFRIKRATEGIYDV
jgi:hypothetical protein